MVHKPLAFVDLILLPMNIRPRSFVQVLLTGSPRGGRRVRAFGPPEAVIVLRGVDVHLHCRVVNIVAEIVGGVQIYDRSRVQVAVAERREAVAELLH